MNPGPDSTAGRHYEAFGIVLESDRELVLPKASSSGRADLRIHWRDAISEAGEGELPAVPAVYRSPYETAAGESTLTLSGTPGDLYFRFPGLAHFRLRSTRVDCTLLDADRFDEAELRLLSQVLAVYLELRGVTMLHAAGVRIGDAAALFLASPHGGKSTLAAEFARAGHPVIGDDLVALRRATGGWSAAPGLPVLKLWPDSARRTGAGETLPTLFPGTEKRRQALAKPGSFVEDATTVRALYLPQRSPDIGRPTVEPIPISETLQLLLRHSFAGQAAQALGLAEERLERLGDLAEAVPARRLSFGDGWLGLPDARAAVERDLPRTTRGTPHG